MIKAKTYWICLIILILIVVAGTVFEGEKFTMFPIIVMVVGVGLANLIFRKKNKK